MQLSYKIRYLSDVGCSHDCKYCYAKSLLSFRGLWNPENPSVANIEKLKRKINKLPKGTIVRLGRND